MASTPLPGPTARWLVRFGYDGSGFYGWARQPGLRTVEGEVRRGVVRSGVSPSAESARIEVASRTDRGVSAVGNALTLTSALRPTVLLRALNGTTPDLAFTAAAAVSEAFRVRAALRRTYRYFESDTDRDFRKWSSVGRRFSGRVDVRSFGRAIPSEAPVWRTVESVTVTPQPGGAVVEVRAPSFVWGMVRKIIGALREVDAGRISEDRLVAAIEGRVRLTLPMAEPERLVLWDVEFPVTWEYRWAGPNRHQTAWANKAQEGLWVRHGVTNALTEAMARLPE